MPHANLAYSPVNEKEACLMRTSPKFPVNLPSMYSSVLASCKKMKGHQAGMLSSPEGVICEAQAVFTDTFSGLPADSCMSPRIPNSLHHLHKHFSSS